LALIALACASHFLPPTVPRPARDFSFNVLGLLWIEVFGQRIRGVGWTLNWWQRLLVYILIGWSCIFVYYKFQPSGPLLAIVIFLVFQIPFVVMKTRISGLVIPDEKPNRNSQIVLGSILFLVMIAVLATMLYHRSAEPKWVIPFSVLAACYFGWETYRWIRRPRDYKPSTDSVDKPISGPFTAGSREATNYERHLKISVNIFLICMAVAIADLLFRNDSYGFILPGVCFVVMVSWLTSLRTRHRETVTSSSELPGGGPH
jgi:hypothetical protein